MFLYPSCRLYFSSVFYFMALDQTKFLDTVLPSGQNIYSQGKIINSSSSSSDTCALSCLEETVFGFLIVMQLIVYL